MRDALGLLRIAGAAVRVVGWYRVGAVVSLVSAVLWFAAGRGSAAERDAFGVRIVQPDPHGLGVVDRLYDAHGWAVTVGVVLGVTVAYILAVAVGVWLAYCAGVWRGLFRGAAVRYGALPWAVGGADDGGRDRPALSDFDDHHAVGDPVTP